MSTSQPHLQAVTAYSKVVTSAKSMYVNSANTLHTAVNNVLWF